MLWGAPRVSNTGRTWQKCLVRFSVHDSFDRLGMYIFVETLETILSWGHIWDGFTLSVHGCVGVCSVW